MAAFVIARESARTAQKTLFYTQPVDTCSNPMNLETTHAQKLYHAFLRVSSLTKTKRLAAFCLLHIDMEVRLTTTLDSGRQKRTLFETPVRTRVAKPGAGNTIGETPDRSINQAPRLQANLFTGPALCRLSHTNSYMSCLRG